MIKSKTRTKGGFGREERRKGKEKTEKKMLPKSLDYINTWLEHLSDECPVSARTLWKTNCQKHGAEAFEMAQVRGVAIDLKNTPGGKCKNKPSPFWLRYTEKGKREENNSKGVSWFA